MIFVEISSANLKENFSVFSYMSIFNKKCKFSDQYLRQHRNFFKVCQERYGGNSFKGS